MAYPQPHLTNPFSISTDVHLSVVEAVWSLHFNRLTQVWVSFFLFPLPSCSAHAVPKGCSHSLPVQTSPEGNQSLWDTEKTWKTQAGTHILCPLAWMDGGNIPSQRKVPYLVPLPHFACKSIFLLGHSERVGFRYLFQLWRLSEMSVWKRECYMCSQGFHNNCIIPILLSFQIAM